MNRISRNGNRFTARDVALIGMMTAVMEVCKQALSFLPNVELVTFLVIMFSIFWGRKATIATVVLTLLETAVYGISTWVLMYLYIWPLLSLTAWRLRKCDNVYVWSALSGLYGLIFGALCSLPNLVLVGPATTFSYWISGIPYDVIHCVSNAVLMFVLYRPVSHVLRQIKHRCEACYPLPLRYLFRVISKAFVFH